MTRPRISVLGSCNMDLVAYARRAPKLGETVQGERFVTVPGGKGANQAIAAARAGGEVHMLGAVGEDHHGVRLRETLAGAGVDVSRVRTVPIPTGTAHITVDAGGGNAIVVVPGANAAMTGLDAADERLIAESEALLLQLEVPLEGVAAAAAAARAHGTMVILTPAPVRPLPPGLLADADLIIANEHEAAQLGSGDAVEGLLALVPQAIVTLGEEGCAYGSRSGERLRVAAPRVEAVDTTAAGDCFAGALGVALAEGVRTEEALRWATAAAALSVQRDGASSSMPSRSEIGHFAATLT